MNVSLTDKQKKYITTQIESGDFQNASEVVRDALRLHQIYRYKIIEELRTEIEQGWSGLASKRNIQDIIKTKTRVKTN